MDSQEPIEVYTVNDPTLAELIRNALHEEGIVCEIGGEGQAGFSGVFDIQILTKASDAERARGIIAELERHRGEGATAEEDA
jgi:Putative prokaryotic signal transducing protein